MSYMDGLAALNLEMPSRVPRTEYSAEGHWALINAVLNTHVSAHSPKAERDAASRAFMKAWNYDLQWSVDVFPEEFGEVRTRMGHANYAAENVDFSNRISSYFQDVDEVLAFDAMEMLPQRAHSDLVNWFNTAYRSKCEAAPDAVNMVGTYVTAMSGMIDLFGWEYLLTALGEDPEQFGKVLTRYSDWMYRYYEALADCDSPVIMVHDDIVWTSGAFVSPAWYREFVFPCYKRYFAPLKEAGKKILFTSDGTYTAFVDDIADCGVHGFVMEPTTDMAYIAEKYGKTHAFVGNADTRILLSGTREEIAAEVKRCMDIGKNCPGFIMAVGNHIPANTPVENALWYNECYERMSKR